MAFLTGRQHIYIAAALTIVIKVFVIPRILKKVIERLNVSRELVMNVNIPAGLSHLRSAGHHRLLHHAADHSTWISPDTGFSGHRSRDRAHRLFYDDRKEKAVTQMVGFLVMENGCFWGYRRGLWHAVDRRTRRVLRCLGGRLDRGDLHASAAGRVRQRRYQCTDRAEGVKLL